MQRGFGGNTKNGVARELAEQTKDAGRDRDGGQREQQNSDDDHAMQASAHPRQPDQGNQHRNESRDLAHRP
ncbi:hypothetical protein GCM10011591_26220 [Nocardia camponoti]|uniref:Uncharacterized protein n=1 Tax=Nocardia camponoti TaxID=1616106 RepID=A0A917QJA2_9NOCA|nr:hypothetical protein GCM10011591_26220 [Nocardia camponoti]